MIKRYISLCCVALILVFSLAAPAHAEKVTEESNFFDVLDYTFIDTENSQNSVAVAPGSNSISVTLPYSMRLYYVDMLVMCNGSISSVSTTVSNFSSALTVSSLGSNLYRIYGTMPGRASKSFSLNFNLASGSYLTFYQLRTCKVSVDQFDIEAYCDIVAADYNQTIHFVPTDEVNHRFILATSNYSDTFFICYIWSDLWRNYDFIDFQLMFDVFEITSISAVMGSENVPLETSYIDGTALDGNSYYISMRMDLTDLDRTSDDYPMITVMGRLDTGVLNSIDFLNCSGGVYLETVNPLFYYFSNLERWILNQTESIGMWFTDMYTMVNNRFDYLEKNLNIWILHLTESIGTWLTNIYTLVNSRFDYLEYNLNIWILNQTESIGTWFTNTYTMVNNRFDYLEKNLNIWFLNQTASLEAAIRGDTSPGNQFQAEVKEELNELDQAQAVMDSVTKPPVDQIDVSVDQYVSQADITVLATPMAVFFEGDIFSKVIIMSILLATVSYVLYGKR